MPTAGTDPEALDRRRRTAPSLHLRAGPDAPVATDRHCNPEMKSGWSVATGNRTLGRPGCLRLPAQPARKAADQTVPNAPQCAESTLCGYVDRARQTKLTVFLEHSFLSNVSGRAAPPDDELRKLGEDILPRLRRYRRLGCPPNPSQLDQTTTHSSTQPHSPEKSSSRTTESRAPSMLGRPELGPLDRRQHGSSSKDCKECPRASSARGGYGAIVEIGIQLGPWVGALQGLDILTKFVGWGPDRRRWDPTERK